MGGLFSGSSAAYAQVKAGHSDVRPFRGLLFFRPSLQHLKRYFLFSAGAIFSPFSVYEHVVHLTSRT